VVLIVVSTMAVMHDERMMMVMVLVGPITFVVVIVSEQTTGADGDKQGHEGHGG
jgi:hypothetical protein